MDIKTKIAVFGIGLLSLAGLTACQSQTSAQEPPASMMERMHADGMRPHDHMNPEQRAEWKKRHAEHQAHFEQVRKACEGKKAGQTVQVKLGEKTIEGTCELRFQPKNPMPRHMAPMMRDQSKAAS